MLDPSSAARRHEVGGTTGAELSFERSRRPGSGDGRAGLAVRRSRQEFIYASAARRSRRASGSLAGPRPDRVAAWAVALGVFLILVASATSKGSTGGASLEPPAGSDGGSGPVAEQGSDPATERALKRFQARLGLPPVGAASAAARAAIVRRMPIRTATWYGPGFYGRRTACGQRLRRSTIGVAHKRLPCGTAVTFYLRGRFTTVPVIDRGPYARGIHYDLTAAAAERIGLSRTGRLRVIH